jgi:hypothetical protein
MLYPENVQLWKLWTRVTLVTLLKYGNGIMGVIWHGDFNSGVAKELTHC